MPKHIQKSFQVCLSRVKISNRQIQSSLRTCKHSKTLSFGGDGNDSKNDAAPVSDDDEQLVFENLRSFYRKKCEEDLKNMSKTSSFPLESSGFFDSSVLLENLSGSSRSSSSSLAIDRVEDSTSVVDDFIAILAHSRSPYEDFRRSMEEMVEARLEHIGKVDWEFMEELLFCYLNLNNEKSCKCIIRAFVDLVVILRENSWRIPASGRRQNGGGRRRH